MTVKPPEKTLVLEAKWHFNSEEERKEFRDHLMSGACFDQDKQPLTMKFSAFFSHCRLCGRPRWMQTLQNGEDECKIAYSSSCQRWVDKGGWKPRAEMGSPNNM